MVLICISLMMSDVELFFMCLLAVCPSSWEKYPFLNQIVFDIDLYDFFI